MKLKYLLIGLVVAPLAAYGIIKSYLYFQLDGIMEHLARQVSPFARLEYKDVATSLDGEASVHGIRLTLRGLDDTIEIEKVSYGTPNIWYLLRDLGRVQNNRLPEKLTLGIRGLEMDLYGEITDRFEAAVNGLNLDLAGLTPLCGGRVFIGPREYRDMGYEAIVIDGKVGFEVDTIAETMLLHFDLGARDMGELQLRTLIGGLRGTGFDDRVHNPRRPTVGPLKALYRDRGYQKRVVKFCAERSEMSPQDYIAAEIKQEPEYFANAWSVVPGDGLRQAYRNFLTATDTIEVSLEWPESATLSGLHLFKAADIPELLHLELKVNGEVVDDLGFSYYEGRRVSIGDRFVRSFVPQAATVKKKAAPKPARGPARYYVVSPRDLGRYIGQDVRLLTRDGKRRDGRLLRIEGGVAAIQQRVHRGEFTMQVAIDDLKKAEVQLRKAPGG
jgi:hypothetical protein